MGSSGLFNSNDDKLDKLVEAVQMVHTTVFVATGTSATVLENAIKEQWHTELEPQARFALSCEWYYFYAHLMDWVAFRMLGEKGRDLLVDQTFELGIMPMVRLSWPDAGDDFWEPLIADRLATHNARQLDYTRSGTIFVKNMNSVLQQGGIPGVNDALSDNPEAKVSRLFQNVNRILKNTLPGLETRSDTARQGAEALGTSVSAMSSILMFGCIQGIVQGQLESVRLAEKIRNVQSLID